MSFLAKNIKFDFQTHYYISKRYKKSVYIPAEFDLRYKKSHRTLRYKKQEIINTVPLSQFIYHDVPKNGQLIRTSPSNPRQIWSVREWQPVPYLKKSRGHTTGSLRAILPDHSTLWTWGPSPLLSVQMKHSGGRNFTGKIKTRHRGGKCVPKKIYRCIDFHRKIRDEEGYVERIEYDPNRSAFIALVRYPQSNRIQYILCCAGMQPGDPVYTTTTHEPTYFKPGFCLPLKYVPEKATICQIEPLPGVGAQLIRSAGTHAKLLNKNNTRQGYALVELQSKELKLFSLDCMCVLGRISNLFWYKKNWGKAGKRRRRGWRPSVRGIAMNPVDHPHGGGQGHKRKRPLHGGGLKTFKGLNQFGFKTRPTYKSRIPTEMQTILKRRPRRFKKGQIL